MRDWNEYIGKRLSGMKIAHSRKREITEELASHIMQQHSENMQSGLSEQESLQQIEDHQTNWQQLTKDIQRAEHDMTHRIKSVLIPGTITLLLFSLSSAILFWLNVRPAVFMSAQEVPFIFDTHLVIFFPLIGAMGAYISRKNDGSVKECLMAGTFPAVVMLVSLCVILLWGMVVDHVVIAHNVTRTLWAIVFCFSYVVFLPALLLLIGSVPAAMIGRNKTDQHSQTA